MTLSSITTEEYSLFRDFIEEAVGIVFGEQNEYLLINRIKKICISDNIKNYRDLLHAANRDCGLKDKIIDAITTNETSWYRDSKIFSSLENEILPELLQRKSEKIRIWCAACSTGQEPYSVSMSVQDCSKRYLIDNETIEIVATDISKEVLGKAKTGCYEKILTARGLSESKVAQYFREKDFYWEIDDKIKKRVKFESINLKNSFSNLGKFDIILCRNVLIYFSPELKRDVIGRMTKQINPGGYLILGGSETMSNFAESFEMKKSDSVVYYKLKS